MLVTLNLYDSRTGFAGVFKVNPVYTIHMYSCFTEALSHKTCGRTDKQIDKQICSGVYRVVPANNNTLYSLDCSANQVGACLAAPGPSLLIFSVILYSNSVCMFPISQIIV